MLKAVESEKKKTNLATARKLGVDAKQIVLYMQRGAETSALLEEIGYI